MIPQGIRRPYIVNMVTQADNANPRKERFEVLWRDGWVWVRARHAHSIPIDEDALDYTVVSPTHADLPRMFAHGCRLDNLREFA